MDEPAQVARLILAMARAGREARSAAQQGASSDRAMSRVGRASTALVTGASSGIGLALARELAGHGHSLALVARDREKLDLAARQLELEYGVPVSVYPKDLAEPGAAEQLWADVSARHSVDILVNNAGVGLYGDFREQPLDALTRMQTLNVVALTTLTRLVLPGLVAGGRGRDPERGVGRGLSARRPPERPCTTPPRPTSCPSPKVLPWSLLEPASRSQPSAPA